MKNHDIFRIATSGLCASACAIIFAVPVFAASEALVKFSTTASKENYDVRSIRQFDWQESGDLVVADDITGMGCKYTDPGDGVYKAFPGTSFTHWAVVASVGDECSFKIHAHARLQAFGGARRAISVPKLSRSGGSCAAGDGCFEVTAAVSGVETARIVVPFAAAPGNKPKIEFLSINDGKMRFYLDRSPDSIVLNPGVSDPTKFTDADAIADVQAENEPFLESTFSVQVIGDFTANQGGHNYFTVGVQRYNKNIIEVQSDLSGNPLKSLTGTTLDSVVSLPALGQQIIKFDQAIGTEAYLVSSDNPNSDFPGAGDQRYKGDANSFFAGEPEAGVCDQCRMTGGTGKTQDQMLVIAKNDRSTYPQCAENDLNCCESRRFPSLNSIPSDPGYNPTGKDVFDASGQIGAPTNSSNPNGEWTHKNHEGDSGQWVFHSGRRNSDQNIIRISCFDEPACLHASANGDFKQIYWDGTGTFSNVRANDETEALTINGYPVRTHSSQNPTVHYYRAYVADLGEDTVEVDFDNGTPAACTTDWSPGKVLGSLAGTVNGKGEGTCDECPDVYQIEIHETDSPNSPIIYTVGAYMKKGNYQIHRPTGNAK